ncbi:MAG: hypothetical protein JWQ43_2396 [Glaciihabitans sp.]|nr:hypothetical protein [Glaciihabitans sp.]
MKRRASIFASALCVLTFLFAAPATNAASAGNSWVPDPTPLPGPYSLTVKKSADVNAARTSAKWVMKFTCAKGERFTLGAEIRQRVGALPAKYAGWDSYYTAIHGEASGVCLGKPQAATVTLKLMKTYLVSPTGLEANVLLPLAKSKKALVAQAYLHTPKLIDRDNPYFCSYIASADEDGTVCEDASQIGPVLRLT